MNLAVTAYARRDASVNIVYNAVLLPNNTEVQTETATAQSKDKANSTGTSVDTRSQCLILLAVLLFTISLI